MIPPKTSKSLNFITHYVQTNSYREEIGNIWMFFVCLLLLFCFVFLFVCFFCFVFLFVWFFCFWIVFWYTIQFLKTQRSFHSKSRDHSIQNAEIMPFQNTEIILCKIQRSFYSNYRDHTIQNAEIIPFKTLVSISSSFSDMSGVSRAIACLGVSCNPTSFSRCVTSTLAATWSPISSM